MTAKHSRIATLKSIRAEKARAIKRANRDMVDAVEKLPAMKADESLTLRLIKGIDRDLYANVWNGGYSASFYLPVTSIKNDKTLNKVLARIVNADLPVTNEDDVTSWCARRVFNVELPNGGALRIVAEVADTSQACRKIEVAKHVEERVEYALICD